MTRSVPTRNLPVGSETCPADGAELGPRIRQHITPDVRYQVRRCVQCGEEYHVAQAGPSGMEITYLNDDVRHPDGQGSLSEGVMAVAPALLVQALSLHRLDVRLLAEDAASVDDIAKMQKADNDAWSVHADRVLYGYLWTLGAYEVMRALHELASPGLGTSAVAAVRDARDALARVRVPLAKGRARSRRTNPDEWFAFPTLVPGQGVGWRLGTTTISRASLSLAYRSGLRAVRDDLIARGRIRK